MEQFIWRLFGWQTLAPAWFDPRPERRVRRNVRRVLPGGTDEVLG